MDMNVKQILLLLALCGGYTVLFMSFYYVIRYSTPSPYLDLLNAAFNFILNFIPITALCGLAYAEFIYLPAPKKLVIKLLRDALLMGLNLIFVNYAFFFVTGLMPEWGGTVFNAIFIFLGVETYYYVLRYKETLQREAAANEELIMSRYRLLKSQVNPHFLFNSLNILNSLIGLDHEKAQKFVLHLGRLYRYIMEHDNDDTISLAKELDFMQTYLELLRIRYGDNIRISISGMDNADMNRRMVPFTLQLLLENITKHNIISSRYPMHVQISISTDSLTVRNSIRMKNSSTLESSGVGSKYLSELYRRHGLSFTASAAEGWYTAQVEYI